MATSSPALDRGGPRIAVTVPFAFSEVPSWAPLTGQDPAGCCPLWDSVASSGRWDPSGYLGSKRVVRTTGGQGTSVQGVGPDALSSERKPQTAAGARCPVPGHPHDTLLQGKG